MLLCLLVNFPFLLSSVVRSSKRMKAIFLCALVLLLQLVSAGEPKFEFCGGWLKDAKVTPITKDFKGGETAKFSLTGTLDRELAAGYHVYTDINVFGNPYESKDEDMCTYEGTPFKCPVAAGTYTWEFEQVLPSVPFAVPLEADSVFRHPDNKDDVMLCMKMSVEVA